MYADSCSSKIPTTLSRTILRHKSNSLTRSHIRGAHARASTHTRTKIRTKIIKREINCPPRKAGVLPPTPPTRVLSLSSFSFSVKKARKEKKGLTSRNSIPISRSPTRDNPRARVHFRDDQRKIGKAERGAISLSRQAKG